MIPKGGVALSVKVLEVGVVLGENGAQVGTGVGEDFGVVNSLATATGLLDRERIVPETTKFLDDAE